MEPYKLFCKFHFKRYLFCLCFFVLMANHKCALLFILSNCSKINFQGHSRLNDRTSLGSGSGHISPPPSPQHTRTHTALISTDLHSYPTTNYRSKRFISKSINLWTNCRDLSETWMRTILPTPPVHAWSVLKYSLLKFALSKLSYLFRGQWQLDIMWTIFTNIISFVLPFFT